MAVGTLAVTSSEGCGAVRSRRWLALALVLVLIGSASIMRDRTSPMPTPILSTVASHVPIDKASWLVVDQRTHRAFLTGDMANVVTVIDTRSGALMHMGHVAAPDGLAIDERTGRVFVTDGAFGTVHMLDATTGAELRIVTVSHGANAVAVDEQTGHVFVSNEGDHSLSMLDARTGTLLRTLMVPPSSNVAPLLIDPRTHRGFTFDFVAERVGVFDTQTGALIHTATFTGGIGDPALDVPLDRFFISGNTQIYVLDARTGTSLPSTLVGRGAHSIMAVNERTGDLLLDDGLGGTYNVRRGIILRGRGAGLTPWSIAIDPRINRAFVVSDYDAVGDVGLVVLDARTGHMRRTIALGPDLQAVAVDEGIRRVIVVSAGGSVPVADPWAWVPDPLRHLLPPQPKTRTVPPSVIVLDETRL